MLRVTTESGSVHEIDQEEGRARRLPGTKAGGLHADGDWITSASALKPVIGRHFSYVYRLENGRPVIRTTTPVVLIEEI